MVSLLQEGGLEHELVTVRRGRRSGIPFVIAIHTSGDGIALGGCRLLAGASADDALADALALSRSMTLKNAAVGLAHGGAKCVISSPDGPLKGSARRAALLDVGDAVEELGGRFVTGKDAGTSLRDIDVLAERTTSIVGLSRAHGGSGDPSRITAYGVMVAIRTALRHLDGDDSLAGRRLAILGLGKVGADLARRSARAGAELVVYDIDESKRARAERLGAEWVGPERLVGADVDVLVPCALSGVITRENVGQLRCRLIAGAANAQLAEESLAGELTRRGILWAPDFIVNAGGLISVASEVDGYGLDEARRRTKAIGEALERVFLRAEEQGITTLEAAKQLAAERARALQRKPL